MQLRDIALAACATLLAIQTSYAAGPEAKVKPLMKDFIGLDVHTIAFKPDLYRPVCEQVRDYHSLYWDIKPGPGTPTRLPKLAPTEGDWMDWGTLYGSWVKAGFSVDAVIQWNNKDLPQALWTDAAGQAQSYGKAFADCFGAKGLKIVNAIEIAGGGDFEAATRDTIFKNMAKGVRDGDPDMKIVTPSISLKGETGGRPIESLLDAKDVFDVISVSQHSMKQNAPTWERTYPEDTSIPAAKRLQDLIAYRNQNLPGKQIWLTGFGYDASTKQAPETGDSSKWVDLPDRVQARYIVRSFLVFSAMDLDRAYYFWFNDSDVAAVHSASGITRNFVPKPSYYAMRHLYQTLGDYRFAQAVTQEPGKLYVHQYVSGKDPKDAIYVAWSPTDTYKRTDELVDLPAKPTSAERMPLTDDKPLPIPVDGYKDGKLKLAIDGSPVYIKVRLP